MKTNQDYIRKNSELSLVTLKPLQVCTVLNKVFLSVFSEAKTNQDYTRNNNKLSFSAAKKYICSALLLGLIGSATAISVTQPVTFDNDVLGPYGTTSPYTDFVKDWGMNPMNSAGKNGLMWIVSDSQQKAHSVVLRLEYPAGQYDTGMKFSPTIGTAGSNNYTHLFLQYDVRFGSSGTGFDWVMGGKLPGLTSAPYDPTGCIDNTSFDGFSARRMWGAAGM